MISELLKQRIKEERLKKDLNQPELAKIMSVSKQTVSNWENGNRIPDTLTLVKLADYFNISLDYLLGRTDDPTCKVLTNKELPFETTHEIEVEVDSDPTPEEIQFIFEKLKQHGIEIKYKKD